MKKLMDLRLYLVTDRSLMRGRKLEDIVKAAVEGGCTMVQLREKDLSTREFIRQAQCLQNILKNTAIPLIINDRIDIALAVNADGVHIGQNDMPYSMARRLLGKDKIIGLSVETEAQLEEANQWDVDYVALSPVLDTSTKKDIHTPWGWDGVRRAVEKSVHPVIGIGGMNRHTVKQAMEYGLNGIAVVSDIMGDDDAQKACGEIRRMGNL